MRSFPVNKTQAAAKLRKLSLYLYLRDNLAKFIPPLKYSDTEEQAQKDMLPFLAGIPFKMSEADWKYLFSLTLRDLARFTPVTDILEEIKKCQTILAEPKQRNKPSSLFVEGEEK